MVLAQGIFLQILSVIPNPISRVCCSASLAHVGRILNYCKARSDGSSDRRARGRKKAERWRIVLRDLQRVLTCPRLRDFLLANKYFYNGHESLSFFSITKPSRLGFTKWLFKSRLTNRARTWRAATRSDPAYRRWTIFSNSPQRKKKRFNLGRGKCQGSIRG